MVVTHKFSKLPNDGIHVPMIVGPSKNNIKFENSLRDDIRDNIAYKNSNYCELTALYWAWKNVDVDVVGLVHYRRYFMDPNMKKNVINSSVISEILKEVDVILPKKRNYYIENSWTHYQHNHNINDLIETKKIINELYPEYIDVFDKVMLYKKSHRFNMLIMKKEKFNQYSEWLFNILFELEKRIDITDYDQYQARVFGFISERLLDVWIEQNDISYREVPFKFTEKQNWIKKGANFLLRKFYRNNAKN